MQELIPLLSGFIVGVALGSVRPAWRWWIGASLAVALGVLATVITGEFKTSWAYILVDIPLVAVASVLGLTLARHAAQRRLRAG
jgi:hypothetical protein